MTFNFIPANGGEEPIRWFEDSTANDTPYYSSTKKLDKVEDEVRYWLGKLGAGGIMLKAGHFEEERGGKKLKRYGYEILYWMGPHSGHITVAGLPMRDRDTEAKRTSVRRQALLNVVDWLRSAHTTAVFTPGSNVLIQHLLVPGTNKTVLQYMLSEGKLPQLGIPVEHGEITNDT